MSVLLINLLRVCFILIIVYVLNFLFKFYKNRWILSRIPSPPGHFFLGNLMEFISGDPEKIFDCLRRYSNQYWPIYRFRTFYVTAINFTQPEDLEIILSGMKHLTKSKLYTFLSNWLGEGLLTSTGTKWHTRRKILTPAFHFDVLPKFLSVFYEETDKLVQELAKVCQEENVVNVVPFISQMTLQSISETAMGLDNINVHSQLAYKNAIYRIGKILLLRLTKPWYRIPFIYNRSKLGKEEHSVVKILHDFAYNVIKEREGKLNKEKKSVELSYSGRKKLALLDLMLEAKNRGENITYEGIREEVDTFMFEGHDTTSVAISFLLLALANHPEIQKKVAQEIEDTIPNKDSPPSYSDLQNLKYTEMVIKESLRLHPSVPFISRLASEDFITHDGYKIPEGTILHMHIFDLHRHPSIYPDPLKFEPERFLPENCNNRHPFAYLPFSAGPRNCIGQKFAMLELKSVLCGILGKFRLEAVDALEDLKFSPDLVLRTQNEIRIKFILKY